MATINITGYINYFRQLAIHHVDLQHDPASETGDAAPGSKKFTRWSAEEVLTGLRSAVSFPALMLELYETTTKSEMNLDVKNDHSGAFTVLASAQPGSQTSEIEAFTKAQEITTDLLQKIWDDHYGPGANRCSAPLNFFDFDGLQITPVGPLINNEFGYRVEFKILPVADKTYCKPPAEGRFV